MLSRRAPLAFLAVAMALWSWCFWKLKFPYVGDIWDDGNYVVSAEALRDGNGYVLPSRPGPPGRPKYPIGLPLLLAGVFSVNPDPAAGYAMVLVAGWIFAAGTYLFARRAGAGGFTAALVAAAAAFACLPRNRWVMADLPLAAVAAVLFARWHRAGTNRSAAVDGTLAGLGFLLRRPGIALLPACLMRPGWKAKAAVLAGFLAVDLPLELYMLRLTRLPGEEYTAEAVHAGWGAATAFAQVVMRNAKELVTVVPQTAAPFLYSNVARAFARFGIDHLITAALWAALLAGAWSLGRKRMMPVWLFCAGTLAIILAWPYPVGLRLAMPLAPATVLAIGAAFDVVKAPRAAIAAWIVLLCGNAAMSLRAIAAPGADAIRAANLARTFDAIRMKTEPDAIIAAQAPEQVFLYTGRQSFPIVDVAADYFRPDDISLFRQWLPLVQGRKLYLLGSCVNPPDNVALQTSVIAREPGFALREIFRTEDCRMTVSALTVPPAR